MWPCHLVQMCSCNLSDQGGQVVNLRHVCILLHPDLLLSQTQTCHACTGDEQCTAPAQGSEPATAPPGHGIRLQLVKRDPLDAAGGLHQVLPPHLPLFLHKLLMVENLLYVFPLAPTTAKLVSLRQQQQQPGDS